MFTQLGQRASSIQHVAEFIVSHCELLINGQYNFLRLTEEVADNNVDGSSLWLWL